MKKFKRLRVSNDESVVTINDNKFHFNPAFSKLAELSKFHYVQYFIEENSREIGFEFLEEQTEDCYSLFGGTDKKNNYRSAAGELIKRFKWIHSVHNQKSTKDKKFLAIKRKNLWIIKLRPSFEFYLPKERIAEVETGTKGIYRYLNNDEKIVYIGKGDIKQRFKEEKRNDWKYSKVEYSIILSEDEQFQWEDFWIEKYKSENSGELPLYNLVSGIKKVSL